MRNGYGEPMSLRARKFIGILLTLAFMTSYALVAMAFGGVFIVGKGRLAEFVFYVCAGLAWLPVEMLIVRWMSRPE